MTAPASQLSRQKPSLNDPVVAGFLDSVFRLEQRMRERLEANLDTAEEALKAARSQPWVEGSQGQLRPHPGFAVAAVADERALALYKQLTSGLDETIDTIAKGTR